MRPATISLGLSTLLCGVLGQSQYKPGSGSAGGSGGFGGPGGVGGFGVGNDPSRPGTGGSIGGDGASGSLEEAIPGVPGDDYPIFAEVPETSFLCDGQVDGGYYADPEAECQVFHICANDGNGGLTKYSFLCPNGTLFQQQYFVCEWWFNVDCSLAEEFYSLNDEVAAEREANSPAVGDFGQEGPGAQGTRGGPGAKGVQTGSRGGAGGRKGPSSGVKSGYQGSARGGSASGSRGSSSSGPRGGSVGGSRGGSVGGSRGGPVGGSRGGSVGGSRRGSSGGSAGGSRGSSGGSRGSSFGGRRGPSASATGSQNSYLAPAGGQGFGDSQSGYNEDQLGGTEAGFVDYDGEVIAADTGYGAPAGGVGGFEEGLGDFPQYTRNSRELDSEKGIETLENEAQAKKDISVDALAEV